MQTTDDGALCGERGVVAARPGPTAMPFKAAKPDIESGGGEGEPAEEEQSGTGARADDVVTPMVEAGTDSQHGGSDHESEVGALDGRYEEFQRGDDVHGIVRFTVNAAIGCTT